MQARRWLPLLVSCFYLSSSRAASAQTVSELDGTRSVCRAGVDSVVARAERARGDAAVLFARPLPNPTLVVEHQRTLSGTTEQETVLGLGVPLGIGGRRWILQGAAAARRRQAMAQSRATLFEAALAFREAYVAAVIDAAKARTLLEQQAALDALSAAVQKLAKGGEAAGYDSLRQLTQARIHRQAVEVASAQAAASKTLLEVWLGRRVTLDEPALDALGGGLALARADAMGRESARVTELLAEASAGRLEARAARRRAVPDLAVFAGYRAVTVGGAVGRGVALTLQMPLTFFDHGQGEAARSEADAQLAAALASRLRQQNTVQLKAALDSLRRLEATRAEAVSTGADARLLRAKAAQLYLAGEATITELLEAFRSAEEAELAHLALTRQIALTRLSLMRAAGSMFEPTLDRDCAGGGR